MRGVFRPSSAVRCPRCGSRGLVRDHDSVSCMACGYLAQADPEPAPDADAPRHMPTNIGPPWTDAERKVWDAEPGSRPSLAAALARDEKTASLVGKAKEKAAMLLRSKARRARDDVSIEHIDENQPEEAAAEQSASDEAARASGAPADEGGEA